jgi:hypothetical protein
VVIDAMPHARRASGVAGVENKTSANKGGAEEADKSRERYFSSGNGWR